MAETKKQTAHTKADKPKYEVKLPDLETFLEAGAHFGHRTSRWNPRMKKFIYTTRDGIHIIDTIKTMKQLKKALPVIHEAAEKSSVLIVGTKGQAATLVERTAKEVGAYYVTNRWPGGLFTNFEVMKKSVAKLMKMERQLASGAQGLVKKERIMLERDIQRLNKIYGGIKFMDKLPGVLIVIDSVLEKNAVAEARVAKVPVVALVDTNGNPDIIDYPIPANDDSIKSITLFMELFAQAIKGGRKANALITMRKEYDAELIKMQQEYQDEQERQRIMEIEERERMKQMRGGTSVVRLSTKGKSKNEEGKDVKVKSGKAKMAETKMAEKSAKEISELTLGARTQKALEAAGIVDVEKLKTMSEDELLAIKGIGQKAVEEIRSAVK